MNFYTETIQPPTAVSAAGHMAPFTLEVDNVAAKSVGGKSISWLRYHAYLRYNKAEHFCVIVWCLFTISRKPLFVFVTEELNTFQSRMNVQEVQSFVVAPSGCFLRKLLWPCVCFYQKMVQCCIYFCLASLGISYFRPLFLFSYRSVWVVYYMCLRTVALSINTVQQRAEPQQNTKRPLQTVSSYWFLSVQVLMSLLYFTDIFMIQIT